VGLVTRSCRNAGQDTSGRDARNARVEFIKVTTFHIFSACLGMNSGVSPKSRRPRAGTNDSFDLGYMPIKQVDEAGVPRARGLRGILSSARCEHVQRGRTEGENQRERERERETARARGGQGVAEGSGGGGSKEKE